MLVATPGRLIDHLKRGTIELNNVRHLVLDEADTMLDMGFIDDIQFILDLAPEEKVMSLFSATMPSGDTAALRGVSQKPQALPVGRR